MRVSKSDHIQFLEASRPQVGRNCLFSRIDAAIALSSKTAERPAAIDQQRFAMGRHDEKRNKAMRRELATKAAPSPEATCLRHGCPIRTIAASSNATAKNVTTSHRCGPGMR